MVNQPKRLLIDPRTLYLPSTRRSGADPYKLQQQIIKFGSRTAGMPLIEVTRGAGGELMITDGVTRATRIAKLLPGQPVPVIVTDEWPNKDLTWLPKIGDTVP